MKKQYPFGKLMPKAWVIEPVHGCNLKCGHCSCRLLESGLYQYMNQSVWAETWRIIGKVTPTVRADLCFAGEPTLHPDLPILLKMARQLAPLVQIQITTNGTKLLDGSVSYAGLLESGANVIYTDMYGPEVRYKELAKASGYQFYEYYNKPPNAISPWVYQGPYLKLIVLQQQPENWPVSRYKAGLLGTWYNHLDWEAAKKFGLQPVTQPLTRRCNQPFIYSCVDAFGKFLLCCQDNWGETSGKFGSVEDGIDGFLKFWFGSDIQLIRRRLRQKNRAGTSYCSRCCITFSRCDFKHWTDRQVSQWWDGTRWNIFGDSDG